MRALSALLLTLIPPAAGAQEVQLAFGATRVAGIHESTFGARASWYQGLGGPFAASVSYANEGHVPGHHRDGLAAQLWLAMPLGSPAFELAAGAGPYQYFDTAHAESPAGFRDAHGTGLVYSVMASWRPAGSRWRWQARLDRHETRRDLDSTMLLVGAAWQVDPDGRGPGPAPARAEDDELTVSLGQTIVNSFESQGSTARALDYRRSLGSMARVSLGWLSEGDARLIRRDGVLARAWLEPRFGAWSVGLGAGAYFAVDEYREERRHVSPVAAISVARRFGPRWLARLEWIRVISNYDRDSDVFLLGAGYRF